MRKVSKLTSLGAYFVILFLSAAAIAADAPVSGKGQGIDVPPGGLWILGFILGYFLTYSIRHGSKTQDVFKGFLGLSGAIGGAAGLNFILTGTAKADGLVSYAIGTFVGFLAYVLFALVIALTYSKTFKYEKDKPVHGWSLFAEVLGKVLLGEDLRPPLSK
jgi:hypothetical protein